MDQDSMHMVAASKVPMLKPGEYELWRIRMEQYIQMVDYSLREVMENGNVPPITKLVKGIETIIAPSTAEEKAQRSSTNGAVNTDHGVTTASTQATAINSTTIDNLKEMLEVADGYANNEGKKILEEHWKKAYCLESVEARLLVYKKNKSVYEEDIKLLKCKIYLKEVAITELRRKLELAQKQKDEIQLTVEKYENSSKSLISDPTVKKHVVETTKAKASADKPKAVKKNNGALIIEDWVSDSEEEDMPQAKIQKKTLKPSFSKIEFVKSKEQVKTPRKTTVKQGNQNRKNTHSPRGNKRN
ncbi:hypothetical protein Tco_0012263 [Tanacetum coccineum]